VLLLGGSSEASQLARALALDPEWATTISFAGRTTTRGAVPHGVTVRVGGFGGIDGLRRHLHDNGYDALVDATHPFAAQMPFHAHDACATSGVRLLRLCRPPWAQDAADRWTVVDDVPAAAAAVARSGARRVFLTVGRQELAPFAACTSAQLLVRCIEPPPADLLPRAEVLLARGPFDLAAEMELLRSRQVELLVSKNSGGTATRPKIDAARALRVPVVMVSRPPIPDVPTVATAGAALTWLAAQLADVRA
jgi:precorrin-6A/cobalt-precorrin-6A reductase